LIRAESVGSVLALVVAIGGKERSKDMADEVIR
jgi:hypothetical protein